MEKKPTNFVWVMAVDDPYTNEVIARALASVNESAGNDIRFTDNLGKEHDGWIVKTRTLNSFLKAQKTDKRLKFVPFVKEGGGNYKEWKLAKVKKPSAKEKKAASDLKELLERKKKEKEK